VGGVWRPAADPAGAGGIEALAFHPLADDAWAGLAAEAEGLSALLAARGPAYGRYSFWWPQLPRAETRILGGGIQ